MKTIFSILLFPIFAPAAGTAGAPAAGAGGGGRGAPAAPTTSGLLGGVKLWPTWEALNYC